MSTSRHPALPVHGRGAGVDPPNRFERLTVEVDDQVEIEPFEAGPAEPGSAGLPRQTLATEYLADTSRSVISRNASPDIPFDASLNPYRGCEHGCAYCYARPTHEFLGFSAGLDFETKILVKEQAPDLLRRELEAPSWQARPLVMSGVTDPYQPVEKRLLVTRGCLEVLESMCHPVGVITKNSLVTRDIDLLASLAGHGAAAVSLSITSLDGGLSARMEPRASHPRRRLGAIRQLAEAGVPVGVMVAPVVPGLTDHEIPAILEAAAEAGALWAGFTVLRLPGSVEPVMREWLERHEPDRAKKVLNRLRSLRGGRLHDARFGHRMRGEGAFAEQIAALFHSTRRRCGLARRGVTLDASAFRPPNQQLGLF